MKLKKILFALLGAFVLLSITIVLLGQFSPTSFENSITEEYYFTPGQVFKALTDPELIQLRRLEVKELEIIKKDQFGGLIKWKEHLDVGGYDLFEVKELVPNTSLRVKKSEAAYGSTGEWTYQIELLSDKCLLTITEKSETENLFARSILVLNGRSASLRREHNNLLYILRKEFENK